VVGVLVGDWPAGASVHVHADGWVEACSPGPAEVLQGARLFGIGAAEAGELLGLLTRVYPQPGPPSPAPRPALPTPPVPDRLATPDRQRAASSAGAETPPPTTTSAEDPRAATSMTATPRPVVLVAGEGPLEVTVGAPHDAVAADLTVADAAAASAGPPAVPGGYQPRGAAGVAAAGGLRVTVFGPPRVFWRPPDNSTAATTRPAPRAAATHGPVDGPDTDSATGGVADAAVRCAMFEADEQEVTGVFQPRTRELLMFLAIHPDGAGRDSLAAALWPDSPPGRLGNTLHTALSRLRRAVRTATHGHLDTVVVTAQGRYRLAPDLVAVDYTRFVRAQTDRRIASTPQDRRAALQTMIDTYTGPLAEGMSAAWLDPVREALRRDALDAVGALARVLVGTDPEQTVELLEIARAFDPFNELLYRDIMRLQARLGRLDAIPRTLALLTTRLAELDEHPSPVAVHLSEQLCDPSTAHRGGGRAAGHVPA
jgi:DNA-binding SARP family transcriptional activator